MKHENTSPPPSSSAQKFRAYLLGFLFSIVLTLSGFYLVQYKLLAGPLLYTILTFFCIVQALIQFVIFLDLMNESKPRWNLMLFLFTIMVTLILVLGSVWIMYNLNYNLMVP